MFIPPPPQIKKKICPTKFWQIFKLSPSIIMGWGGGRNHRTPPFPPYKGEGDGWVKFLNFLKKRRGSDFSRKNGKVGKIGEVVFKKVGITYLHTN